MNYSTVAKKSSKPRIEPVFVSKDTDVSTLDFCVSERFRIVLFKKGVILLQIDEKLIQIVSPGILILNENNKISLPCKDTFSSANLLSSENNLQNKNTLTDKITFDIQSDFVCKTFYFSPSFLNKKLDFQNIREQGMEVESAVLENRFLLRVFTHNDDVGYFAHLSSEEEKRVLYLMESAEFQLEQQDTGWWPCKTRSYLTELLFFIVRLFDGKEKNTHEKTTISQSFKPILDYINRLYNTKLTLDKLCEKFATNRTTLNKNFNAETGMSAMAYIIDLRLRIAYTILCDTDLSIAEIAERTGFSDTTHFERLFKKKYKKTPIEFRKK